MSSSSSLKDITNTTEKTIKQRNKKIRFPGDDNDKPEEAAVAAPVDASAELVGRLCIFIVFLATAHTLSTYKEEIVSTVLLLEGSLYALGSILVVVGLLFGLRLAADYAFPG